MTRLQDMFANYDHITAVLPPDRRPRLTTRGWAASILEAVAECGAAGCFPEDVTAKELGWALHRLLGNAPEGRIDGLAHLLEGFAAAQTWYDTGERPEGCEPVSATSVG